MLHTAMHSADVIKSVLIKLHVTYINGNYCSSRIYQYLCPQSVYQTNLLSYKTQVVYLCLVITGAIFSVHSFMATDILAFIVLFACAIGCLDYRVSMWGWLCLSSEIIAQYTQNAIGTLMEATVLGAVQGDGSRFLVLESRRCWKTTLMTWLAYCLCCVAF